MAIYSLGVLLFHLVTGCSPVTLCRGGEDRRRCGGAPAMSLFSPAGLSGGLAAGKLVGRSRPSVMCRMLGIVIILPLVFLGVWLLAWIGWQILRMMLGQ